MLKVSVIMPVFNASNYLKNTLKSVVNQNIDDIELICVNDGSNDTSLEILKKYASRYPLIKIISQEYEGPGISRNRAIQEASGEYISFINAGDIYLKDDSLTKMYDIAKEHKAKLLGANIKTINEKEQHIKENIDSQITYFTEEKWIPPQEYGIPKAFYRNIYKKDFLLENNIEFPDLISGEDNVFLTRALTSIDKICITDFEFYGLNSYKTRGIDADIKITDTIKHYIQIFDILNVEKFNKTYEDYKKDFIDYLNNENNINNPQIKENVWELLDGDTHFKSTDYGYLILDMIKDYPTNGDKEYDFMKYCIFEESLLENTFIDTDRLKDFLRITKDNNQNHFKSSFCQLKKIENYTNDERRQMDKSVNGLKANINHNIRINNLILTSNSWKITGFLRSKNNDYGE